jgi:hypothetical protein
LQIFFCYMQGFENPVMDAICRYSWTFYIEHTYDRVISFAHRERWMVFIQSQDAMKTVFLFITHYVFTIHSLTHSNLSTVSTAHSGAVLRPHRTGAGGRLGFDPRTVHPVVRRYTDYAMSVPKCEVLSRYIPRETQERDLQPKSRTQGRIVMPRDTTCFVLDYCVCLIFYVQSYAKVT